MSDSVAGSGAKQATSPEVVEIPQKPKGKSRIKPRQLSPLMRQMIVEQFRVRQSSEDVAEEMRVPARTVTDIVILALMKRAA